MSARLSRRKLAAYAANTLIKDGESRTAMKIVAAYLVETGRTREYELIVRDIEDILASHGIVVADVTTARPLSEQLQQSIAKITGSESVQIRHVIDESVLAGIKVKTPSQQLDATLRYKLNNLRAQKL